MIKFSDYMSEGFDSPENFDGEWGGNNARNNRKMALGSRHATAGFFLGEKRREVAVEIGPYEMEHPGLNFFVRIGNDAKGPFSTFREDDTDYSDIVPYILELFNYLIIIILWYLKQPNLLHTKSIRFFAADDTQKRMYERIYKSRTSQSFIETQGFELHYDEKVDMYSINRKQ